MVYDGYFGRFVPVQSASFDVSLDPKAVVRLPLSFFPKRSAPSPSRSSDAMRRLPLVECVPDASRRPRCVPVWACRVMTVIRASASPSGPAE